MNSISSDTDRIGLGGSCHWCTEAVFLSLKGVLRVKQGWIASGGEPERFSEGVVVHFNPVIISLQTLIPVHLHTHSCASQHSMRDKYRSAVYAFNEQQALVCAEIIETLQAEFSDPIITKVLDFGSFILNKPEYLNYYFGNPDKPFCQNIVNPKLKQLLRDFNEQVDLNKLNHLT